MLVTAARQSIAACRLTRTPGNHRTRTMSPASDTVHSGEFTTWIIPPAFQCHEHPGRDSGKRSGPACCSQAKADHGSTRRGSPDIPACGYCQQAGKFRQCHGPFAAGAAPPAARKPSRSAARPQEYSLSSITFDSRFPQHHHNSVVATLGGQRRFVMTCWAAGRKTLWLPPDGASHRAAGRVKAHIQGLLLLCRPPVSVVSQRGPGPVGIYPSCCRELVPCRPVWMDSA